MHNLRLTRDIGWWTDKATGVVALAYAAVDRHLSELGYASWGSIGTADVDTVIDAEDVAHTFWKAVTPELVS